MYTLSSLHDIDTVFRIIHIKQNNVPGVGFVAVIVVVGAVLMAVPGAGGGPGGGAGTL